MDGARPLQAEQAFNPKNPMQGSTMTDSREWKIDYAKDYIGREYSEERRGNLADKIGLVVRPIGKGYITTKDYREDRINLLVEGNVITGVSWG